MFRCGWNFVNAPFKVLSSSQYRHLGYLLCLHMEITGGEHHFSPGETRQEGRGPRCQSTNKTKRSTKKPTPSTGVQPSHLEHPRLQYFAGFFDVGVGGDPVPETSVSIRWKDRGLFFCGALFGFSDSQVLCLARRLPCRSVFVLCLSSAIFAFSQALSPTTVLPV